MEELAFPFGKPCLPLIGAFFLTSAIPHACLWKPLASLQRPPGGKGVPPSFTLSKGSISHLKASSNANRKSRLYPDKWQSPCLVLCLPLSLLFHIKFTLISHQIHCHRPIDWTLDHWGRGCALEYTDRRASSWFQSVTVWR